VFTDSLRSNGCVIALGRVHDSAPQALWRNSLSCCISVYHVPLIAYLIALTIFHGEYVAMEYATRSDCFFFEEIKIIAYLETKNRQNTGTQEPLK
jgi:hypothetical protein